MLVFIDQIFWGHKLKNCRKNTGRKCQAHNFFFFFYHFFFIVADISVKENHDSGLWHESNNRQQFYQWGIFLSGRYFWEFLVGVCRPVLQILTLFQTKKCHFSHSFSDLASKKLCSPLLLTALDQNTNKKLFLKIHFEFAHFSFFLIHLELKWWIRSYTPVVSTKTIPNSRPKRHKIIPFGAYPSPGFYFHTQLSYTPDHRVNRNFLYVLNYRCSK